MGNYNRTLDALVTQTDGSDFVVDTSAYTANDLVGDTGMVKTGSGGGMKLRGVSVRDTHRQKEPYIIHIYRSEPTSDLSDGDPLVPTVADGDLEIGTVTINAGDYVTANGNNYSKAYVPIDDIEVREDSKGTFYTRNQCLATPDYNAATDIKIEFLYWMD